jgi:uncharacterized protein YbjT (DUF2867 family)
MRILVTGAYGLIGSACLARLHRDGHDLVAAGRDITVARRRFAYARWVEADFLRLTSIEAWRPLLADIDLVVNCVGVLQDGAGDDTRRVHVAGTGALFDCCLSLGIRRVVHISALGVDAAGPSNFARTKAAADRHLAHLDLDWCILRPGLVMAPAAYGGSALLRGIAGCPFVTPLIEPDARLQVVSVDDIAATVAYCAGPNAPGKVQWDVAHPSVVSLAEIVVAMRRWLGFPAGRLIRLPHWMGTVAAAAADLLGRLGWRSPLRSTTLAQLSAGAVGDPGAWMAATGIRPADLGAFFAARPSTVQDRWFAHTYLLKPLAIGGLALASISAGISTLASGSFGLPTTTNQSDSATTVTSAIMIAAALLNIALGLGVLRRSTARAALFGMLLMTLGVALFNIMMILRYTSQVGSAAIAIISTAIPMMLAPLFALAVLDDR